MPENKTDATETEDETNDKAAPAVIARWLGDTIKKRIWYFLNQSMTEDEESHMEPRTYSAQDLLEICEGDLITSKRNRYKNLNVALRQLIRDQYVVTVPMPNEIRYRFNTEDSRRIGISELMGKNRISAEEKLLLTQTEKHLRKIYNLNFVEKVPEDFSAEYALRNPSNGDVPQTVALHYRDFVYAAMELIDLYKRPDMYLTVEERIKKGMPHISVDWSYLSGK